VSKGSPPEAPNYVAAAQQQGQDAQNLNAQQTWANRPNQYGPWRSPPSDANQSIDPATGQPITQWNQQTQLTPELQNALNSQIGLQTGRSDLAGGMLNRVQQDFNQPFDWANLPQSARAPGTYQMQSNLDPTTQSTNEAGFSADRERYTQGAFDQMRPEHQFQEEAARTKLANQGLTPGSEGYNRELQRLGQSQAGERWNAVNQGGIEQQRMQQMLLGQQQQAFGQQQAGGQFYNQAAGQQFGQDLQQFNAQAQSRQQAIAEQAQQRGMSLNEMNALLSGQQVSGPQMPGFTSAQGAQPTNYLQAAGMQGNAAMQQWQGQQQQDQGMYQGLGMLGSAAMMYFSDERLKSNVIKVGTHPLGVGIYEYDIFGHRERGVIAQELLAIAPELVFAHSSGYLVVNYGGLQ